MQRTISHILLITCLFLAVSCQTEYTRTTSVSENVPVSDSLAPVDSAVLKIYLPFKKILEKDMSRVISISDKEMIKDKPESTLTNFLADLLLKQGEQIADSLDLDVNPDVSYFNYGGIRTYLPEGQITVGKVYELMPFENEMVFLEMNGADLKSFLDVIAQKGGDSVGGVRFIISNGKATEVMVNGEPLDMDNEYWLVTNDYVAGGGDDLKVLLQRNRLVGTGRKIRDVIISYLESIHSRGEVISAKTDGRIIYE